MAGVSKLAYMAGVIDCKVGAPKEVIEKRENMFQSMKTLNKRGV